MPATTKDAQVDQVLSNLHKIVKTQYFPPKAKANAKDAGSSQQQSVSQ